VIEAALRTLLTTSPEPAPCPDVATWWRGHLAAVAEIASPIERAIVAGFAADRPAWAFASGYQEALHRLVPALGACRGAMCATEEGGAHPSAIKTRLDQSTLDGAKQFVTLGGFVEQLLIVASVGQDAGGRNRLVMVRIPASRAGVTMEPMPATPFVPEVPMARMRLERVQLLPDDQLEGDGFDAYLKPFRTVEDLHVHAALVAWLVQVARRAAWPRPLIERMLSELVALHALAGAPASDAAVHVAIGGVLAETTRLLADLDPHWATADADSRARWQRDRIVLGVAGKARAQRLEVAWRGLGG
jgi:acyl-CoA dehydrogenase